MILWRGFGADRRAICKSSFNAAVEVHNMLGRASMFPGCAAILH
jgi:hypothetical protein